MKNKVIFILGPTGSGKTALAVRLAAEFNGEIISADSRQIYKRLDIGTGKDLAEYDGIKYHLIDVANPGDKFTLFDWLDEAKVALSDIFKRGKLPIVVGGTGLYAKALYDGYCLEKSKAQISKFKQNPKLKFQREELDKMSLKQLQKLTEDWQLNTENLDLKNPRRLIRAIEKAQEGIEMVKIKPDFDSLILAIDLDREGLYQRIDRRVDIRFEKQNMLEEVEELLDSGVSKDWLSSLGLEYKIISEYLTQNFQNSKLKVQTKSKTQIFKSEEFQKMAQELKWKTHAYARRQLTWLRKQEGLIWIKDLKEASKKVEKFLN